MRFAPPSLSVGFTDANNLLAGVLNLKGFKVFKSKSALDCLSMMSQIQHKIDVVLIDEQSAVENNFYLVNELKKITSDTMIVIIADEDVKLRGENIDEFILRPINPENLADKVLYMLAKRELKRLKEAAPEYQINFNYY